MRALHVFDFDDTLIRSDSRVHVTKDDGTLLSLNSTQYKDYKKEPDDEFDYSEFAEYPKNPQFIDTVLAELKAALVLDGSGSVVILTARADTKPVVDFLADNGLVGIEVVGTGTDDPYSKANYILGRLKSEELDEVIVFEDSIKNIRAIRKVVTNAGYKLETNRVTLKGVYTKNIQHNYT